MVFFGFELLDASCNGSGSYRPLTLIQQSAGSVYSFVKVLGTETRIAASFGKGLVVSNINSTLESTSAAWELYVMAAVLLEMTPRTVVVTNTSCENSAS